MMHILVCLFIILISSIASAQQLAFRTAEGFGRFSTGGRAGFVCYVTSTGNGTMGALFDGGPHHEGTFRYCLGLSGARNILFSVAGIIDLVSHITVTNPNVTIAGQTAPGKGILLKGMWLTFTGDDVIIRHFRSRPGYDSAMVVNGGSAWKALHFDTMSDAIVDHSSFSWATDDTISSFHSQNITWQWVISTEGLGQPNYGRSLTANASTVTKVSVLNSYLAHNQTRSPQFTAPGDIQMINTVNYNISAIATRLWPRYNAPQDVELVANYFKPGPSGSASNKTAVQIHGLGYQEVTAVAANNSRVYLDGNIHTVFRPQDMGDEDALVFLTDDPLPYVTSRMTSVFPVIQSEVDAFTAKDRVLLNAGATVPQRDATDTRVLQDFSQGDGIVNGLTPTAFGGYDTYTGTSRTLNTYDTDRDGIPNAWETLCSSSFSGSTTGGLSNSDRNDGNDILDWTSPTAGQADLEGYSKLEIYLNELAGDYPTDSCGGLDTGDTTGPTVSINAPTAEATISASSVTYSAIATDADSGMLRVDFYVDGNLAGQDVNTSDSTFSMTLDTTQYADGNRQLWVIAYDQQQNSTQSATVNVTIDNTTAYTAINTASAPTVNGNLSEFASANLIEFDAVSGNTTDCKMMYDATNLYVGCTTTDANLTEATTSNDNSSIFSDDSLEIVIDPNNSNGAWTSSDYKLAINVHNDRYDAHTQSDTAWTYGGSTAVALVGDIDSIADDTSWTVEAAIPWSSIGVTPSTAATYAVNLQINDKDGTASTVRYRWNGTSSNNLSDAMDVVLGEPVSGGDTTDPTVSVTAPLNGATIGGTYTIRADAQDDSGILDVQFYRDTSTAICSADTAAPFECALDTTALSEGSHTFHAVARDNVSPTPNDATSATITATVDNTATSAPSTPVVTPSYSDIGHVISLNWDNVTDALSYQIERCDGASCSDFEIISTEILSDYLDEFLARKTEYCYRIRAFDAAANPSSYSSTVCDLTFDAILLDEPSTLSTTHSSTVASLGAPSTLSTTHSATVATLGTPSTLSTTHSTTPVFLGNPSGLSTP